MMWLHGFVSHVVTTFVPSSYVSLINKKSYRIKMILSFSRDFYVDLSSRAFKNRMPDIFCENAHETSRRHVQPQPHVSPFRLSPKQVAHPAQPPSTALTVGLLWPTGTKTTSLNNCTTTDEKVLLGLHCSSTKHTLSLDRIASV